MPGRESRNLAHVFSCISVFAKLGRIRRRSRRRSVKTVTSFSFPRFHRRRGGGFTRPQIELLALFVPPRLAPRPRPLRSPYFIRFLSVCGENKSLMVMVVQRNAAKGGPNPNPTESRFRDSSGVVVMSGKLILAHSRALFGD